MNSLSVNQRWLLAATILMATSSIMLFLNWVFVGGSMAIAGALCALVGVSYRG